MALRGLRHVALLAVTALALAACAGPGDAGDGPAASEGRDRPEADDLVDVLSPDAIPAIDEPKFIPPDDADWLADREPVVALEIDGDARAYPLQIMTWHEIVNDRVGGRPVAVTYCPLCNSALAFDRRVGDRLLDFGTSGKLYQSDLVMYDRQTESLWTQLNGEAIDGELDGTMLEFIPAQILSFSQWKEEHPAGKVLSRDTGHTRSYGRNPYVGYDSQEGPSPGFFEGDVDDRLPAMARVAGVAVDEEAVAYPYQELARSSGAGVTHDTVGGRPVAVFWKGGVASALDEERIAEARDVGSTGVFVARAEGRDLTFAVADGRIVDRETGSEWSIGGTATSGALEGRRLERIPHVDTFWFAWQTFHPGTRVFGE